MSIFEKKKDGPALVFLGGGTWGRFTPPGSVVCSQEMQTSPDAPEIKEGIGIFFFFASVGKES